MTLTWDRFDFLSSEWFDARKMLSFLIIVGLLGLFGLDVFGCRLTLFGLLAGVDDKADLNEPPIRLIYCLFVRAVLLFDEN